MQPCRKTWGGLALGLVFGLTACGGSAAPAPAQIDSPFPMPGPVGATAHVYPLETGWFEGRTVNYYNLGANTPLDPTDPTRVQIANAWVFATGVNADGSPNKLAGQGTLFDTAPGDALYSDLWQIYFVTPSADYAPGSITSHEALPNSGLPIEKKPMLVNCPIVPAGSTLADGALELQDSHVKDAAFAYFDFGPTSPVPGKLYAFVTGFDDQGQPVLVPGQHFVFDNARGQAGYSDFWMVHWVLVDNNYVADTIRAAADVPDTATSTANLVVNYPHK